LLGVGWFGGLYENKRVYTVWDAYMFLEKGMGRGVKIYFRVEYQDM
jgi:hypothetical protein